MGNYDEFLNRLRALKEQKKLKNATPTSPNIASPNIIALKVKQTVTSSKDLPLIQEQQQKKQNEMKKIRKISVENIDTFKPNGGLNDDFFADLNDLEIKQEEVEDEKNEQEDTENIAIKQTLKAMIPPIVQNEEENEEEKNKENEIQNGLDIKDKHHEIKQDESTTPNMAYSRMPDLKINGMNNKMGGKLQALMKVENVEISESDSDEYGDELLVISVPKKIQTETPKIDKIEKIQNIEKIQQNIIKNEVGTDKKAEDALNEFMDDLMATKSASPISPKSNDINNDDEELEDKKKKKKKKKKKGEEKKKKKKKKKKKS